MVNLHELSDYIDDIKETLTDAQYITGMNICKKMFHDDEGTKKPYLMTYLQPVYNMVCESDDEEDGDSPGEIHFELERRKAIVFFNIKQADMIRAQSCVTAAMWVDEEEVPFNTSPMDGLPVSLISDHFNLQVEMKLVEVAVISLVPYSVVNEVE